MSESVKFRIENKVAHIILSRPEKKNALSPEMITELTSCFTALAADEQVRAVIIKADGNVFSAGADLDALQKLQHYTYEENLMDSMKLGELFQLMYSLEKLLIAQVEGNAIAGGCGLISVCDIVFSVPDVEFGYPEVRIGFIPALVSAFLLKKIGEGRAKQLLLTGELINAPLAYQYGLINFICPREEIAGEVMKYAEKFATTTSGAAVQRTKRLIQAVSEASISEALKLAAEENARARLTDDCRKGIASFLNKKAPKW